METITIALTAVLALLLAAAFYLVLSAPGEKKREEELILETCNFSKPSELEDNPDADMARAEAESEFIAPEPKYAETEEDFGKLEIHLKTASSISAPRCLRLMAGIFIEGYRGYKFMDELLKAMPEKESANVLDAMEMARNPELYMDNHPECQSECKNENCPYSKKK